MPFVGSIVEPTSLSRRPLPAEITSFESEAIVNNTLASVLRQLASVSLLADEIFSELRRELRVVSDRASSVVQKLKTLEDYVGAYDPKAVLVPESDMCAFSRRVVHFASKRHVDCALFTASTRPCSVRRAYARAASPNACVKQPRRSRTSVRRRLPSLTMETSKPAVLSSLRRWTWAEAVGPVTCEPGANAALAACEGGSLHVLPSPDEVNEAVARTFPGYTVALDTSGRLFDRQSSIRRSRGPRRGRRRNTVAGGDISQVLANAEDKPRKAGGSRRRSKSESRLAGIKDWGRAKLRSLRRPRSHERQPETASVAELSDESSVRLRTKRPSHRRAEDPTNSSSGNWSASSVTSHTKSSSPGAASRRQSGSSGRGVSPDACCHGNGGSNGFRDDDDSVYSCDTEGYYTSFHVDSGLKEVLPATAERSTTELCNQSCESQYQLFGKGSTSTTASSNNTVCTALLNPAPPPRLSSLGASDAHSLGSSKRSHSVSSHSLAESNPSSESTLGDRHGSLDSRRRVSRQSQSEARNNFLNGTAPAELGAADQPERRKVDWKSLNARRIPSMCVVTPPTSDDEPQPNLAAEILEMAAKSSARNESEAKKGDPASKTRGINKEKSQTTGGQEEQDRKNPVPTDGRSSSLSEKLSPASEGFCSETEFVSESTNIGKKITPGGNLIGDPDKVIPFAEPEYATLVCRNEPMSPRLKERDTEYVSLKELKTSETSRTGARVTLDAAGKVVYCSDSLRRTKKSFEPGATRPASQEALGRSKGKVVSVTPVRVVRPTQRGSTSPTARNTRNVSPGLRKDPRPETPTGERIQKDTRTVSPISRRTVSPTSRKEARTVSPLLRKEYRSDSPSIGKTSRTVSPISRKTISPIVTRETSSPTRQRNSPGLLQTSFDDPLPTDDDEISPDETDAPTTKQESPGNCSEVPPRPANPEQLTNYLQRTNPALFRRINEPKIHRTDSYKMANVSNVANPRHIVVPTVSRPVNTKRVKNPNLLGRKVYGTEIRVDPKILPAATERAKVLSAASPVTTAASSTPTRERGVAFDASLSPIGRNESQRGANSATSVNAVPSTNFVRNGITYGTVPRDMRYFQSPVMQRNYITSAADVGPASHIQRCGQEVGQNRGCSPVLCQNQRYSPNMLHQNPRYSPNVMHQNPRYSPKLNQNQRYSPSLAPQNQIYIQNVGQNQIIIQNLEQKPCYGPNFGQNVQISPNSQAKYQRYSPNLVQNHRISPNLVQNQRISPNPGQNPRYSPNLIQHQRYSPNLPPQIQKQNPNFATNPRHSPSLTENLRNDPNSVPNTMYYCQNLIQSRQSPIPNVVPSRSVSFAPIEIRRSPLIGRDDFRLLLAKHSVDQSQKLSAAQRLRVNQSEKSLAAQRFGIDQTSKRLRAEQSQAKENIEVNGRPSFETAL